MDTDQTDRVTLDALQASTTPIQVGVPYRVLAGPTAHLYWHGA
jgi:hypothetical protein